LCKFYKADDNESFYKIGKTFVKIAHRFRGVIMPYNYEIIKVIVDEDGEKLSKMENTIHKAHKHLQFLPVKVFDGRYECFSEILDIEDLCEIFFKK
jgi:hypothetical protein